MKRAPKNTLREWARQAQQEREAKPGPEPSKPRAAPLTDEETRQRRRERMRRYRAKLAASDPLHQTRAELRELTRAANAEAARLLRERRDEAARRRRAIETAKSLRRMMREAPSERAHRRRLAQYGLTPEEFIALFERQGYACGICKTPAFMSARAICIDHCRETHQVRGLLCDACNTGIGQFRHDPERLRAAIAYLTEGGRQAGSLRLAPSPTADV